MQIWYKNLIDVMLFMKKKKKTIPNPDLKP